MEADGSLLEMASTLATTTTPIRIRLQIQRNDLPAVQTLWPIPATSLKRTVAQLIEEINDTFPLESDTWGLEHYTITIGGYECLHYHSLGDVLKDEDEVVVRPLLTSEVRARKVLGRDQIAGDGRHMLDGLPWGRTKVTGLYTPNIRIPPRKRRRLDDDGTAAATPEDTRLEDWASNPERGGDLPLALELAKTLGGGPSDDEEDEEDEVEIETAVNAGRLDDIGDDGDEDDEVDDSFSSENSEVSSSESDGSDSEDDDVDEDDTSDTGSDVDSSSDDGLDPGSWNGIEDAPETPSDSAAARETKAGPRVTRSKTTPKGSSESSGTTSARSKSTASKLPDPEVAESPKFVGIPNTGSELTKSRNARRRNQKELKYLKAVGVLPTGASLADMRDWKARKGSHATSSKTLPIPSQSRNNLTAEPLHDPNADTGKDTSTETFGRSPPEDETMTDLVSTAQATVTDTAAQEDFELQRQKLLQAINSGGLQVDAPKSRSRKRVVAHVDGDDEDEAPEEMSTKVSNLALASKPTPATGPSTQVVAEVDSAVSTKSAKSAAMAPSSVANRSRLNLDSSRRLLFGSLGVRVPKNQQEEVALQKRLSDRNKQRVAPPMEAGATRICPKEQVAPAPAGATTDDSHDESWRDKIELSAVECCEERVELSTPPFPFYQRWDPQQRRKKAKARASSACSAPHKLQRRRARDTVAEVEYVETYDKYNTDGNGDALDYDDVENEDDEYWEEGALLNGEYDVEDGPDSRLQNESSRHQNGIEDDGFPPLPPDISALPALIESDAQTDDFVVYHELVCSAATNWQPSSLTRTVQLKAKEDGGSWEVVMALRDLRPKQYDAEGQRVYEKFEMEGLSDAEDEEEEKVKVMGWGEMGEVRLLARKKGALEAVSKGAADAAVDGCA